MSDQIRAIVILSDETDRQVVDSALWDEYSLKEMSGVTRAVEELYGRVRLEPIAAVSAWELVASEPHTA